MNLIAYAVMALGIGFIVAGLSIAVSSFLEWRTEALLAEDRPRPEGPPRKTSSLRPAGDPGRPSAHPSTGGF